MTRIGLILSAAFAAAVATASLWAFSGRQGHDDPAALGRVAVERLDWSGAVDAYEHGRAAAHAGSAEWARATFALAVATQQVEPTTPERIDRATGLFREVIDAGVEDAMVARAMMNLGRIAELRDYAGDVADLGAARQQYERVMRRWPDTAVGSEAALRAAATLVMTYDAPDFVRVRSGIALLERWATDHPANPYAGLMWQYAGDTCFRPLNDYPDALRCYDAVDRIGWPDEGNQAVWYWRAARLADRYLNDRERAVHYYTELLEHTPTSAKAFAASEALRRLGAPVPDVLSRSATTRNAEATP